VNLYLLQHPQSWLSNLDGRTKLAVFFVYVLAVLSTKPGAYLTWLSLTGLLLVLLALARLQIRWIAFPTCACFALRCFRGVWSFARRLKGDVPASDCQDAFMRWRCRLAFRDDAVHPTA